MADRTFLAGEESSAVDTYDFKRLLADRSEGVASLERGPGIDGTVVVVGSLVALSSEGSSALVTYRGQPGSTALRAQTTVSLDSSQIGLPVVLAFEDANPARPIVIGCVRKELTPHLRERPDSVQIDADGDRLMVSAKEQLVLRCGNASITLTKAGKIIIEGAYVSNRSSGVLRLRGASVQIN